MDNNLKLFTETLHPIEVKLIRGFVHARSATAELGDADLVARSGLEPPQVRTGVEWLKGKGVLALVETKTEVFVSVTELGERYARYGLPEVLILSALKLHPKLPLAELAAVINSGSPVNNQGNSELAILPEEVQPACGALRAAGCIAFGEGATVSYVENPSGEQQFCSRQELYCKVHSSGRTSLSNLTAIESEIIESGVKKRGKSKGGFRLEETKHNSFALTDFGKQIAVYLAELGITGEEIQELTPEILASGEWKDRGFRKYNINLKPSRLVHGRFHAYRQYVDFLKKRMVALGFKEMVGSVVETEFWDMDALFMPQFHSAREIHDVYFLKEPRYAQSIPEPYLSQVAQVHQYGATSGKRGWGYEFDQEKCRRLILRSQTTALSARTLAAQPQIPGKYFGIARCFRYDQVDASHAPDFFQVEGIVVDPQANFRSLLGLLEIFAREIAMAKEVKFVPAYFPFTEPSVEVHMKHPRLGWMELGGAGIFRREVCEPLGIEVPVIAWGLGTDRMAMVALQIDDIRDLCSCDLDFLRDSRIKGVL